MTITFAHMQQNGQTAAQWASANPVLAAREFGVETDTRRIKVGDGTTVWNSLPYLAGSTRAMVNVLDYNAKGNGTTDDTAAINAALAAVSSGGIVLFPGGLTFLTTGNHAVPRGVLIMATGATIQHTGNNSCFVFQSAQGFSMDMRGGMTGGRMTGTSTGTSAVAIQAGNQWGFTLKDMNIAGYSAGVGVLLKNTTNWCEGTLIEGVKIDSPKTGIRFEAINGNSSFGYTQIISVAINVPANGGVGIDFGSTSTATAYVYNSIIDATLWLYGPSSVGVLVAPFGFVEKTRVHIVGECFDANPHTSLQNTGGTFKTYGHLDIPGAGVSYGSGVTRVLGMYTALDSVAGTSGAEQFTAIASNQPDTGHGATFGWVHQSNQETPFVSGYSQGDLFRVYAVPFNSTPAGSGTAKLAVDAGGNLRFGGGRLWVDDATGQLKFTGRNGTTTLIAQP